MKRARIAAVVLLGLGLSALSFAGENYALVVTGASGGEPYATKYTNWRQSFVSTLRTKFGYPDDHVIVIAESPGAGIRTATRDEVRRTLLELRGRLTQDDQLVVLLIGHGTTADGPRGEDAKFNLVGPDLKASEWGCLRPLASPRRLRRHDGSELSLSPSPRRSWPYRRHGDRFDRSGVRNRLRRVVHPSLRGSIGGCRQERPCLAVRGV